LKINRPNVDVKPFASQSKTEERTVFGSKEITDKLEKNLNSDFYRGWGIVPVSELPTMQDFNAVEFTISGLAAYLFQNGMAEYADKQTYYKNSLCVFEGDIYKSKTDNNAGNPLTDNTQWQSLKDAILAANIVQQLGSATDKVTSQKLVTDALNTKQAKGDYATKIELTQGLNTKLNSAAVKQTTGNSTTDVISQKACDDNYAKKDSWETFTAGEINIKSNGSYASLLFTKGDGNKLLLETAPGDAYFVYRDTKNNNKAVVTIPSAKNGTLALTADVDAINNYPVGAPIPWPQSTPPSGYLVCNGTDFDKVKYPQLALAYPSGKLPDLRGEFIRGVDPSRSVLSSQQATEIRTAALDYFGVDETVQESSIGTAFSNAETATNIFPKNAKAPNNEDLKAVLSDNVIFATQANSKALGNSGAVWISMRPRNIAFNYIVRAA